jgi:photosystem II stability/assembly factor-like uncharacterized protein
MNSLRSHILGGATLAAVALVAAILTFGAPTRRAPEGPRKDAAPGHYPSDWFHAQRAFPSGVIDHERLLAAIERAGIEHRRLRTSAASWTPAGPYNIGGRVTALAVVPGGATVFLGSANGGVFKSLDGGVNWTAVFNRDYGFSIGALALDPSDPDVVYCGTGEANSAVDTYDGAGLYRSTDGGTTWAGLGLVETRRIGRVAVDPSNPDRIFVAAMGTQFSTNPDRGLYRSEDGGQSWTKVLFVSDSTGCADVVINPANPETVYCSMWERVRRPTYRRAFGPSCGIWRSTDSGTTWTRLLNGLPAPGDNVGRIGLAIAASQPSTVYAQIISGASGGYTGLGLYRTTDGGASWTRRDVSGFTGIFGGFGWYFGELGVDPTNPNRVFAMGVDMVRSTDGGANFSSVLGGAHVDQHAIWIDPSNPDRIYLGNDGGFYSTATGAGPWFKAVTLDITQFYAANIDPANPARLIGGTQDNNTMITSGSPSGWTQILGGDGFHCVIDPVFPNTILAEYQFGSGGSGPLRTTNGGGGWSAPSGIITTDRFNWSTPIVMNPLNRHVVLTGSHRVYRSTNNGVSYSPISGDLTQNLPSQLVYSTLTTLDICPSDTSLYYAGSDDGKVWRSTNRGGIWTDISAGLPVRWVTRVVGDPVDPMKVYVTLSGFGLDEHEPHVYRSTDRGTTWTPVSGNLPDVPVNDVVVDPLDTNRLYVATDTGVWWTSDGGSLWVPLGQGLPFTAVFDLNLHAPSRTLVAATHGRSQWKLDLDEMPVAVPGPPVATRLALSAPAPNPARGPVRCVLALPAAGHARVAVFDAAGRRLRVLLEGGRAAGSHAIEWDGRDERGARAARGVYFLRASAGGETVTRRLVRAD